ncbi:hypothetical protein Dalk_4545 [Desulfatibacillum aliphaticivorans]|uniref:Uncharacterized protein n=1 Tax=Desulfatibacillum aliphaticivorans TaxID=218208 RepID=B8FCR0_DESAL|nr:hypothetical protein [Desulfatibacillum aliphaticivorans]ACL06223.1 hypothetical protein Dalk_4545 [Desulfatibacillum aliphaticivorans]
MKKLTLLLCLLLALQPAFAGPYLSPESKLTGDMLSSKNLSDLKDVPQARQNLGIGTAANYDVGTGANNIVQLDGSGALPAVDGSNLTGISSGSTERYGCITSNHTDASHDIQITAGYRVSTSDHQTGMTLASAMVKRIDAAWAAGTGNGGMLTGSVASGTWYHLFLIGKADGTVDAGFYTGLDPTAVLPSGYTLYRRVASVKTDGSANILAFHQIGNRFIWDATPMDLNSTTIGTTATSHTISVPSGVQVIAHLNWEADAQGGKDMNVFYPGKTAETPAYNAAPGSMVRTNTGNNITGHIDILTNTSSQINVISTATSSKLRLFTRGWTDISLQ